MISQAPPRAAWLVEHLVSCCDDPLIDYMADQPTPPGAPTRDR